MDAIFEELLLKDLRVPNNMKIMRSTMKMIMSIFTVFLLFYAGVTDRFSHIMSDGSGALSTSSLMSWKRAYFLSLADVNDFEPKILVV